jgi:probable rRNA maturation factor
VSTVTLHVGYAVPRAGIPSAASFRLWVEAALRGAKRRRAAELSIRLVGIDEGRALNRDYRHKDYATNVLTFDYAQEPVVLADLVLCAPVVESEARALGKPLAEHYAHLIVHGTLHAQGWDHETSEADAQAMETRESDILRGLGLADPYQRSDR